MLSIIDEDYPENFQPVIRRLMKAISEPAVRDIMQVEDEYLGELENLERAIARREDIIARKNDIIAEQNSTLAEQNSALAEQNSALAEQNSALAEQNSALAEKDSALAEKDSALAEKDSALAEKDSALAREEARLARAVAALVGRGIPEEDARRILFGEPGDGTSIDRGNRSNCRSPGVVEPR